jgi:hypothetical protein
MDILLTLAQDESRWWSAEQLGEAIGHTQSAAAGALELLAAQNLLDVKVGSTLSYRFSPVHAAARQAVAEAASRPGVAREAVTARWR